MRAKERHRRKLIEYIGNPENDFPTRTVMAVSVCNIRTQTFYAHFSLDELSEIETEGLDLRRMKYSPGLSDADRALLKEAKAGDVPAIKLAYQRFEDWAPKTRHEVTGKNGGSIKYAEVKDRADELKDTGDKMMEAIKNGGPPEEE